MRSSLRRIAPVGLLMTSLSLGCAGTQQPAAIAPPAVEIDTIYVNGEILTMADTPEPVYVEAIAIDEGKIVAVGSRREVEGLRSPSTQVIDLAGKTMLPGFIDGHSHFINAISMGGQANVYAEPFGPGSTKQGIIDAIKKLQADRNIAKGEIILAYGYDDSIFPDGQKLTAADLDPHFPDNPVLVQHVSLHGAVLNTAAFKKFNITADTPVPPGGVTVRKPGTNEPEGLLMEGSYLAVF